MALKQGNTLPHFSLENQVGTTFGIDQLLGKKPFVVYFYPKDFTPGFTKEACDFEACNFRDSYQDFKDMGIGAIGISSDSAKRHGHFAKKHDLPFILLADRPGKIRKKFQVKSKLFGLLPGRETFVFDKNGKLIMRYNNLQSSSHTKKALQTIKNLTNDN